jgi:predicted ester cyclase
MFCGLWLHIVDEARLVSFIRSPFPRPCSTLSPACPFSSPSVVLFTIFKKNIMGFFRRKKKPVKEEAKEEQQQQQQQPTPSSSSGITQRMMTLGTSEPLAGSQQQLQQQYQQQQQQQQQFQQQQQQQQQQPASRIPKPAPTNNISSAVVTVKKAPPPQDSVPTSNLKDPPPALKSPPPQAAATSSAAAAAAAYVPPAPVIMGPNASSGSKQSIPALKSPPPSCSSSHDNNTTNNTTILKESSSSPPSVTNLVVGDPSLATPDVTRELIKRFIADIWNRGALDMIPQVCSPSLRFNGNVGMDRVGHDGFAHMVTTIRNALSDYHCEVHSMVVESNKAFCRLRFTGRHTGDLLGFAPTGKLVAWMGAAEFTCKNGRIMKVWELGDVKSLEEQLQGYE